MPLKKEVNIKINGEHIKGTIVNGKFKSEQLVVAPRGEFDIRDVEAVIDELKELLDTMESVRVADKLSENKDVLFSR